MGNVESIVRDSYREEKRVKANFRRLGGRRASEVHLPARWTSDHNKVVRRVQRFQGERKRAGRSGWDQTSLTFALSKPFFSGHGHEEIDWECTAILGQGSFGTVGLWQQLHPATGTVLDIQSDYHARLVECYDYTVPMEALCMNELRDCPTICKLRSVKEFDARRGDDRVWRLYQEFCENHTLKDMVKTYIRYNEQHPDDPMRIPESYIWWVWHGLALSLQAMSESGRCPQMVKQPPDKKNYIVHLDIKDNNVLLGKALQSGPLKNWPVIKLCDWGLASVTSKHDSKNSARFKGMGTTTWFPPEQFRGKGLSAEWHRDIHPKNKPYTSAHGCWQLAALIYEMIVLETSNAELYDVLDALQDDEEHFRRNDYKLYCYTPNSEVGMQYSRELLELLEDCLNLKPEIRPSPERLLRKTMEGCKIAAKRLEYEGTPSAPYVFYGKNGVDDMNRWREARINQERRGRY